MKLSKFLLSTLLASAVMGVQAQTKTEKPKDKKAVKTMPKKGVKTEPKKITPVVTSNNTPRKITADYCPPCGRG